MELRRAKEQDIGQIIDLILRIYDEIFSKVNSERVLEKFKAAYTFENMMAQMEWKKIYVIEEDGEIIATGSFANFGSPENPKYAISNLYVKPERHHQGLGKALFDVLYEDAKSAHADRFHVPSSKVAVGFYKKMGFEVDEEQPDAKDELTWMSMVL